MKKLTFSLKKGILIALALAVLLPCVFPMKHAVIARIILMPVEKKLNNEIEFGSSKIWLPGHISLKQISVVDESGRLYYAETADLKYNLFKLLLGKGDIDFILTEIKFYGSIGLLDSVADMLIISKMPDVGFDEISGILQRQKGAVYMRDIYAHNDSMRIRGDGWIDNNASLDCSVNFSFSREITDKIPDAIKKTLLSRKTDPGWRGISFKVRGNYRKPSLHISGDRLKLNIMKGLFGNE